jgi:AcrR family transcriptional regulator
MPATRPDLHRDTKRREILDAAETLLLRDGYANTTMAAIARAARVANNSVYWYFPSKDDLLAAVLQRRQERALAEVADVATSGLEQRVLALLAQLDQVAILTAAVHERARHNPAVADMHRAFHATAERELGAGFRDAGLRPQDAGRAAAAIMAIIEGIHLHEEKRDPVARNRLILWTVDRFLATSADRAASPP